MLWQWIQAPVVHKILAQHYTTQNVKLQKIQEFRKNTRERCKHNRLFNAYYACSSEYLFIWWNHRFIDNYAILWPEPIYIIFLESAKFKMVVRSKRLRITEALSLSQIFRSGTNHSKSHKKKFHICSTHYKEYLDHFRIFCDVRWAFELVKISW